LATFNNLHAVTPIENVDRERPIGRSADASLTHTHVMYLKIQLLLATSASCLVH